MAKKAPTHSSLGKLQALDNQISTAEGSGALAEYEDIISDILARLPVKSLMRFRCVSKPWRALIANPYFAKKHFGYAQTGIGCKPTSKLLVSLDPPQSCDHEALKDGGDYQSATVDLEFPVRISDYPCAQILGSCHGLVCVLVMGKGIVLWNPCTRESKLLPNPPLRQEIESTVRSQSLHFNLFYGFGYDSTSDDYKCVVVESIEFFNEYVNEVPGHHLTLKTGSWRSGTHLVDVVGAVTGKGCLLNGYLHWNDWENTRPGIVSFNLAEDKFEEIVPMPPMPPNDIHFSEILVFRNCLCGVGKDNDPEISVIWIMEEFGIKESWTRILKFPSVWTTLSIATMCLCILENGEILVEEVLELSPNIRNSRLILSNKQNTRRDVYEVDMSYGNAIYTETLVSPVTASIADIE